MIMGNEVWGAGGPGCGAGPITHVSSCGSGNTGEEELPGEFLQELCWPGKARPMLKANLWGLGIQLSW